MPSRKPTVAVDLDGVICHYDKWKGVEHFGEPFPGAKEFLTSLREAAIVVIHTCRCNTTLNKGYTKEQLRDIVSDYLEKHKLPYDDIYIGQGKIVATAYIDDRAVCCQPDVLPDYIAYRIAIDNVNVIFNQKG